MANYLFLKESTETIQIGSLTTTGIVTKVSFPRIYTEHYTYESNPPTVLLPLLIMDVPEGVNIEYIKKIRKEDFDKVFNPKIPFHSNEQVYNWLKSKGIKPEPDMLIEFDGEVLFWKDCLGFGAPTTYEFFKERKCGICWNNCKQYAIMDIQPPEVKQESEEQLFMELLGMADKNLDRDPSPRVNSKTMDLLKQHFKIERRK